MGAIWAPTGLIDVLLFCYKRKKSYIFGPMCSMCPGCRLGHVWPMDKSSKITISTKFKHLINAVQSSIVFSKMGPMDCLLDIHWKLSVQFTKIMSTL